MNIAIRPICLSALFALLIGAANAYAESEDERLVDQYSKCSATFGLLSKSIEALAEKVADGDPKKIEGGKYGAENFMHLSTVYFQKAYELAPKEAVIEKVEKHVKEFGAQQQIDLNSTLTVLLNQADECKLPEQF